MLIKVINHDTEHQGNIYQAKSSDDGWATTDSAKFPPNSFIEIKSESNPDVSAGMNVPRDFDIEGAPFSIGTKVKIKDLSDIESFEYISHDPDEIIDKLINSVGVIIYYDYDCGCSQIYPDQPMIGVKLENGETHEFWPEEIIKEV